MCKSAWNIWNTQRQNVITAILEYLSMKESSHKMFPRVSSIKSSVCIYFSPNASLCVCGQPMSQIPRRMKITKNKRLGLGLVSSFVFKLSAIPLRPSFCQESSKIFVTQTKTSRRPNKIRFDVRENDQ